MYAKGHSAETHHQMSTTSSRSLSWRQLKQTRTACAARHNQQQQQQKWRPSVQVLFWLRSSPCRCLFYNVTRHEAQRFTPRPVKTHWLVTTTSCLFTSLKNSFTTFRPPSMLEVSQDIVQRRHRAVCVCVFFSLYVSVSSRWRQRILPSRCYRWALPLLPEGNTLLYCPNRCLHWVFCKETSERQSLSCCCLCHKMCVIFN